MKKIFPRILLMLIIASFLVNLAGCASLKRKFTRKKKKVKKPVYYKVREYDIRPSLELYEKHYIYWVHWQRKFISELGRNFKNDIRSIQEICGELESMAALLTDEEAEKLRPHIERIKKAENIIKKRNMTKANDTRIRKIAEQEYRIIRGQFSSKKMADFIRKDWKLKEQEDSAGVLND